MMKNRLTWFRSQKGFTLTEAMVVIGIAVILVGFGYSAFSSWMKKERVRGAAHQLSGKFKRARFIAMEKHTSHSFRFDSSNGVYQLFADPPPYFDFTDTAASNIKIDEVDLLKQYPGVRFSQNFAASQVRFDVTGMPKSKTGGFGAGTVTFSNDDGFQCKVIVAPLGRARIACDDSL